MEVQKKARKQEEESNFKVAVIHEDVKDLMNSNNFVDKLRKYL